MYTTSFQDFFPSNKVPILLLQCLGVDTSEAVKISFSELSHEIILTGRVCDISKFRFTCEGRRDLSMKVR